MLNLIERVYDAIGQKFEANPIAWVLAGLLGYSAYSNNDTTHELSQICLQMTTLKEVGYGLTSEQIRELRAWDKQLVHEFANLRERSTSQKMEVDNTPADRSTAETLIRSIMQKQEIWGRSPLHNIYEICSERTE